MSDHGSGVRARRAGLSFVEALLVLSLTAVAVVVVAYVAMPDLQRGVRALVRDVEARW